MGGPCLLNELLGEGGGLSLLNEPCGEGGRLPLTEGRGDGTLTGSLANASGFCPKPFL